VTAGMPTLDSLSSAILGGQNALKYHWQPQDMLVKASFFRRMSYFVFIASLLIQRASFFAMLKHEMTISSHHQMPKSYILNVEFHQRLIESCI
jgi:hypothetical protein